jgi:acetate kinase
MAADLPSESRSAVLVLNSGSSSLKFGLYQVDATGTECLLSGEAGSFGDNEGRIAAIDVQGNLLLSETLSGPDPRLAITRLEKLLVESGLPAPSAIGHRIVHGGPHHRQHCIIDDQVLQQLEQATAFAPLHTPPAIEIIGLAQRHFPELPQVACFDTVFHAELPEVSRTLPIAKEFRAQGIYRYGFHGLSCESIVRQLGSDLPARLVIAHLGNGASITAVRDGKSIDTSMGLTPTGGIIMGTRCGDLDPGVLVYLMREKQFDVAMIEALIDHRSGMTGISGVDSDMRRLREISDWNGDANLAIRMFCYSVCKEIGAMIAALGGVDLLVFTGGIGENDAAARSAICADLSWMGIDVDDQRNLAAAGRISAAASRVGVRVLVSQEDEQIARHSGSLTSTALCRSSVG